MRRYKRLKSPPLSLEKKTITTIVGIVLLAASVLLFLSFFTGAGALLSFKEYFYNLFGVGVIFVPLLIIILSLPLLSIKNRLAKTNVIFGTTGALLSAIGLIAPFSQNYAGLIGSSLWLVAKSLATPLGAFLVLF